MQTVRTMIAERRGVAGLAIRAAIVAGCGAVRLRLQHRPAESRAFPTFPPTIACAIRSRSAKPTARSKFSSAPIAASSMRRNARKCWHSRRPGSARRPAESWSICRSALATSARRRSPCAQFVRSWRRAACRRTASSCAAITRPDASSQPIRVTYPKIGAQAGPCGLWPAGYRAELQPRLFRKPAVLELRLRQPTQPRRDGR